MTFNEFKQVAVYLKAVYTRDNFLGTPEAMTIWYQLLGDLPAEVVQSAVQKYTLTQKFPPTIAEIRELSMGIMGNESKDWGEAWEQVRLAIKRYGYYDTQGALESLDEVTRKVVKQLGWKELCISESPEIDRANFRMMYETASVRQKEQDVLPQKLKDELQRIGGALMLGGEDA